MCFDAHQNGKNDDVNRQEWDLKAPQCDDPPLLPGLVLNESMHSEVSHTKSTVSLSSPKRKIEIRKKPLSGSDGAFICRILQPHVTY